MKHIKRATKAITVAEKLIKSWSYKFLKVNSATLLSLKKLVQARAFARSSLKARAQILSSFVPSLVLLSVHPGSKSVTIINKFEKNG